jgi:hypothetical protein
MFHANIGLFSHHRRAIKPAAGMARRHEAAPPRGGGTPLPRVGARIAVHTLAISQQYQTNTFLFCLKTKTKLVEKAHLPLHTRLTG